MDEGEVYQPDKQYTTLYYVVPDGVNSNAHLSQTNSILHYTT